MATFTCSECEFSKQVAAEMAGKKARCPKCNAVNNIPLDEESTEPVTDAIEPAAEEPEAHAAPEVPETEAPAAAEAANGNGDSSRSSSYTPTPAANLPPLSSGWLMGFGGAAFLMAIGAVLLLLQSINFSMICFAAGTILFLALAIMFAFADTFAKKK